MELGATLDLATRGRPRYKESCLVLRIGVLRVFEKSGGELTANSSDLPVVLFRLKLNHFWPEKAFGANYSREGKEQDLHW